MNPQSIQSDHDINAYPFSNQIIVYHLSHKDCFSECWLQGSLLPGGLSLTGINVILFHLLSTDDKRKLNKYNFQAFRVKVPSVAWEWLAGLAGCQLCVGSGQWSCTRINSGVNGEIIESQFVRSIFFCPEEWSPYRCEVNASVFTTIVNSPKASS